MQVLQGENDGTIIFVTLQFTLVYIGTSTPATPYCARQTCAPGPRPVVVRRVQAPFKSSVMQVVCSSCRALSSDGDEAGRCDKQAAGPLRAVRQGGRGSRRRHHRGTASAWRPPRSSPPAYASTSSPTSAGATNSSASSVLYRMVITSLRKGGSSFSCCWQSTSISRSWLGVGVGVGVGLGLGLGFGGLHAENHDQLKVRGRVI